MNDHLISFEYHGRNVRTVLLNGEPWWVLKDVCAVLEIGNSRDVAARLDGDEKGVEKIDTLGGAQDLLIISEAGLYSVIFRSNKPEAKTFKRWVTHEVLPQIRKTGGYNIPQFPSVVTADTLQAFVDEYRILENRNKELILQNAAMTNRIELMQPKAEYYDIILQSADPVPITVIAKDYGVTAARLNTKLHEMRIQYKVAGQWVLYQEYAGRGYTATKTFSFTHKDGQQGSSVHTYWTQLGRTFLYDVLKAEGMIPLIEQTCPLLPSGPDEGLTLHA